MVSPMRVAGKPEGPVSFYVGYETGHVVQVFSLGQVAMLQTARAS